MQTTKGARGYVCRIPFFYFLEKCGGSLSPDLDNEAVKRLASQNRNSFKSASYKKPGMRETQASGQNFNWMVNNLPPEKVAIYAPYFNDDALPLEELQQFCQQHFEKAFLKGSYTSFFRKLFCLYDFLKYGKKTKK